MRYSSQVKPISYLKANASLDLLDLTVQALSINLANFCQTN